MVYREKTLIREKKTVKKYCNNNYNLLLVKVVITKTESSTWKTHFFKTHFFNLPLNLEPFIEASFHPIILKSGVITMCLFLGLLLLWCLVIMLPANNLFLKTSTWIFKAALCELILFARFFPVVNCECILSLFFGACLALTFKNSKYRIEQNMVRSHKTKK